MKKISLIILSLGSIFAGCSKSSSTSPTKSTAGLSGTYVSYKSIDTTYNNRQAADGIEIISLASIYGDTVYTNPGTSNYLVEPIIQNDDPKTVFADTLRFSSSTAGSEHVFSVSPIPFTYNIATGAFHNNADSNDHQQIIQLNATTIEFIEFEQDGQTVGQVTARYYHKL